MAAITCSGYGFGLRGIIRGANLAVVATRGCSTVQVGLWDLVVIEELVDFFTACAVIYQNGVGLCDSL